MCTLERRCAHVAVQTASAEPSDSRAPSLSELLPVILAARPSLSSREAGHVPVPGVQEQDVPHFHPRARPSAELTAWRPAATPLADDRLPSDADTAEGEVGTWGRGALARPPRTPSWAHSGSCPGSSLKRPFLRAPDPWGQLRPVGHNTTGAPTVSSEARGQGLGGDHDRRADRLR